MSDAFVIEVKERNQNTIISPPIFNVSSDGTVLVSSAFAVLLIMLYRQLSESGKVKDGKV